MFTISVGDISNPIDFIVVVTVVSLAILVIAAIAISATVVIAPLLIDSAIIFGILKALRGF